ncbi:MAG: hypothetical protein R8J94_16895 [Acidimicrobiia bacterium]|nr:hypothetical protein [Acidimicrobiia bacterium]
MPYLSSLVRAAGRSSLAVAAVVGLMATSIAIAGVATLSAADPPSACGSAGTPPWPSFDFSTFSSGRYVNVATFDGTAIDAIPEAQGSSTATGTFTSDGSVASLTTDASGQIDIIWKFVETGTTNPVPVLASWTIGDIDSVEDTPGTYIEAVEVSTDDLFGFQLNSPTAIVPDTADPSVILFPGGDNNTDTPTPGDATRDTAKVQLDFAGTSEATISYLATSSGRIFRHNGAGPDISTPTCTGVSDHDGDGLADIDDPDDDNDGITDAVEGDGDTDSDGIPNYKDLDSDSDGIGDATEDGGSNGAADFDGDGTPNYIDLDSDGDKILDADESGHAIPATAGVIPGPFGANGWSDSVDTIDDETNGALVTEDFTLQNADGGTVDYLENADIEMVSITSPSVVPGLQTSLTLTIRNNGIGDSGDVTVDFPLPASTTLNVAASPGCTFVTPNVECVISGPIADGASPTAVVTLDTLPSAAAGSQATSATIGTTNTPDANGSNNTAAGTFTFLNPIADVEVTSVSSPSVTPGNSDAVTVAYVNNGPSDAQAFDITYPLPSGTSFVAAGSTAGCALNGTSDGVTCAVSGPTVPTGTGSVVFNLAVAASTSAGTTNVSGTAENQAVTDDDGANDSLSATFTVTGPVADIEVSASTPAITPGETGTVTLTLTYESGPSTATASNVVYVLPTDVTVSGALPGLCTEGPVGTVTCGPVDLSSGTATYDIDVLVAPTATPSTTLDGTVSATTTATDADGASGEADITTNAAAADLAVVVTDPATPLVPGTSGTVTIAVSNSGPSNAAATSMTYVLPTGVDVDTSTSLPGGCSETPSGTVVCTVGALAPGAPVNLAIPVLMPADAPDSTTFGDGTATATTTATDPTPADNTNINSTITSGIAEADLAVTLDSVPVLTPGQTGQIDATVTNVGPSQGGSVDVTFSLPTGVVFDGAAANPNGCTETSGEVTCPIAGPIVDGAPVSVVVPVQMSLDLPTSGPIVASSVDLTNQTVSDPAAPNDVAAATIVLDLSGDSDGDGIPDADEIDPESTGTPIDTDGDGVSDFLDIDSDNDGILDADETDGGDATIDTDLDGVPDYRDLDSDNDGIPDVEEGGNGSLDADDDGTIDAMDDPSTGDTNNDGLADSADTSPVNTDGVGPEDYRDLDADDDGVLDTVEGGNAQHDLDDDGTIDAMDDPSTGDINNDGLADTASTTPPNTDGVGNPDYQDLDSDDDGVSDVDEGGNGDLDGNDDGVLDDVGTNDGDGDGVHDGITNLVDTDNDGIPDVSDADTDGDGIPDVTEGSDDFDGDGIPNLLDLDSDNDGITDVDESGNAALDGDDNGVIDDQATLDANNDGLADTANTTPPNVDGDPQPNYLDLDSDGDGMTDVFESGNGLLDANNDGTIDAMDDPSTGDLNGDGLVDSRDPAPTDTDGDSVADFLELDSDDDGIPDAVEAGPNVANPRDTDADGTPNFQDLDSDGDTIPDSLEAGTDPTNPATTDGDSRPDYRDLDSDGDGIPDAVEAGPDGTSPRDTDDDGIPDFRELDSDDDGIADAVEAGATPAEPIDTDEDGTPDYRDLDSDDDGFVDEVESASDPTIDADEDGIPDFQDPDVTRILGVVTDANGNPLGGLEITITDSAGNTFELTTESDGSYELVSKADAVVSPGVATVTAVLSGGGLLSEVVTVVGGVTVERNLQDVASAAPLAFTGAPTKRMVAMTIPLFVTGIALLLLAAKLRREDDFMYYY